MKSILALAVLVAASFASAQQFDEITKRNMSPQWGTSVQPQWSTVLVGSMGDFQQAGTWTIGSYDDWTRVWPHVAGSFYRQGQDIPRMIDWNTQQLLLIALGNTGQPGYGLYVEDIQRSSSFGFDVRFAISQPNFQAGASFHERSSTRSTQFSFGNGTNPFIVLSVPRYFGFPNFYSRFYSPPQVVILNGGSCGPHTGAGRQQVWMVGAGGVLMPYTPPGQKSGGN
ncbi:MAG TPA: hypothetical protein VNI20_12630 [Fimbriimonadaceae bacterium]|nr:hypothetical protein [Fimbriimonadaceae bacterium]